MKILEKLMTSRPSSILPLLGFSTAVFMAPMSTNAQVLANFADGNSTRAVDGYVGTAGNGWNSAWGSTTFSSGSFAATEVRSNNPLTAGQNRLAVNFRNPNASGHAGGALHRALDSNFGVLNADQPRTVQFEFRLDSPITATTQSFVDMFEQGSVNSGVRDNARWLIRIMGSNRGNAVANEFAFYDGGKDGATFDYDNFVSSGITVQQGQIYTIAVHSDPVTQSYSVSNDDGNSVISFSDLGWWGNMTTNGNILNFGAVVNFESDVDYSIGSISVIPELHLF